jgi:hypothetical protein
MPAANIPAGLEEYVRELGSDEPVYRAVRDHWTSTGSGPVSLRAGDLAIGDFVLLRGRDPATVPVFEVVS